MRSKIGMLLVLIFLCSGLTGCATGKEASVRPLDGDFFFTSQGERIVRPNGTETVLVKKGAWCSDEYLSEILFVKAKESK